MSKEYINGRENFADCSGPFGGFGTANLKEKARNASDDSKYVFNFAYSDYGGYLFDRAMIEFAKKYYPDCIVWEEIGWNGQNAYIFGELAEEFTQYEDWWETEYSRGGYFNFFLSEEFEIPMEEEAFEEIAEYFDEEYKDKVLEVLNEYFCGYWSYEPNFLDYSIQDLKEYLEPLGIAPNDGW